jgi:hypothetical protein
LVSISVIVVLAQNKLVSLLDGQKESLSAQLSHLTSEVEKLRDAFRDSEEEVIYWKTEAVAAKELLAEFKGKKGVQFAHSIAAQSGVMTVVGNNRADAGADAAAEGIRTRTAIKRRGSGEEDATEDATEEQKGNNGDGSDGEDENRDSVSRRDDDSSTHSDRRGTSKSSSPRPVDLADGPTGTMAGSGTGASTTDTSSLRGVLKGSTSSSGSGHHREKSESGTMQALITIPAADKIEEVSYRAMAREGIERYVRTYVRTCVYYCVFVCTLFAKLSG